MQNNDNIYDTVRKNIRKYRRLKCMTQQELADKLNIQKIEKDEVCTTPRLLK